MNPRRAVFLAMPVAGFMIGHQVAARAVRDAMFLSAWPVSTLPAMVIATAIAVVFVVPLFARLFDRFGPHRVVSIGFLASAAGHLVEWRFAPESRWIAVVVFLHVAGFSNLLLSGFWSVLSELVDPRTARSSYGRIAAAGTVGGLVGGIAVAQVAAHVSDLSVLLLLAGLHFCCAGGVLTLRPPARRAAGQGRGDDPAGLLDIPNLKTAPHLRTLALIVVLGAAAATVLDFLLKAEAVRRIDTRTDLLAFFATFYVAVQILTVLSQLGVAASVRRFGLGRTISALPAGVGAMGAIGLLYPTFPLFALARGAEAVLRGSLFRSAYELVFVPMAPEEKRRAKTFLDVTCDRAGDAVGAAVVQIVLLTGAAFHSAEMLAAVIAMATASLWLGSRLDALYLGIVERRLTTHALEDSVVVGSETGWSIIDLPQLARTTDNTTTAMQAVAIPVARDARLDRLAELRSGDRARVERAVSTLDAPDALEMAQVIELIAWNDLVPHARALLEREASVRAGMVTDALLDPRTDFAIRRRLPRILATVPEQRALAGLMAALDDSRFEVRYQCSRAIRRVLAQQSGLSVDATRIIQVVDRELSVPVHVWRGHRLIDQPDQEDESGVQSLGGGGHEQRNLEHVFSLLAAVYPAEPLKVAFQGLRSDDAALRGVAIEYLEGVLPRETWTNLWRLVSAATPSDADAPGQSGPPRPATPR